eukprot:2167858-Rhodomonas_salina.2
MMLSAPSNTEGTGGGGEGGEGVGEWFVRQYAEVLALRGISLRAPYALSGTDIVHRPRLWCYAIAVLSSCRVLHDMRHKASLWCSVMCGTDVRY